MELKKNKRNKIHNEDNELNKKLHENSDNHNNNFKKFMYCNESDGYKNTDTSSNILSNTYENVYDYFSSNSENSEYKSNNLVEFYLYNEINNHKYNNNLYDFYLSKINNNLEEKNKVNETNLNFINKIPYLIKKESSKWKTWKEKKKQVGEEEDKNLNQKNKENWLMKEKEQWKKTYSYNNKNENVKNVKQLMKQHNNYNSNNGNNNNGNNNNGNNDNGNNNNGNNDNGNNDNGNNDNGNNDNGNNDNGNNDNGNNDNGNNNNAVYNVSRELIYDGIDSDEHVMKKVYETTKSKKTEDDENENVDNLYFNTLINKCDYTISCYMYKKTSATHIYRKKILMLKKNFLITTKFKQNISDIYKVVDPDVYDISHSTFSSICKSSNNIYKFSVYAKRLSRNNTSSSSTNKLKYNYIYVIIDVDEFLYYYKYEYNNDMFIPLFSDKQNKIIFYFYTDLNVYLGHFIFYSYEIEKHIDFDFYKKSELNNPNVRTDFFLSKNNKYRNISLYSSTSSNRTDKIFGSFDSKTHEEELTGFSLLNQKNIFFDKNYFFVRKLYNEQKKNSQKNSRYNISDSSDNNLYVHIFIYKSKNRFEYLLPYQNTTNLLCDNEDLVMSNNNLNNNYQLINLFLNNVKRTMQIKNRINYFLDKQNNERSRDKFLVGKENKMKNCKKIKSLQYLHDKNDTTKNGHRKDHATKYTSVLDGNKDDKNTGNSSNINKGNANNDGLTYNDKFFKNEGTYKEKGIIGKCVIDKNEITCNNGSVIHKTNTSIDKTSGEGSHDYNCNDYSNDKNEEDKHLSSNILSSKLHYEEELNAYNDKRRNGKNEENMNEKIFNNLRKYFKNKNVNHNKRKNKMKKGNHSKENYSCDMAYNKKSIHLENRNTNSSIEEDNQLYNGILKNNRNSYMPSDHVEKQGECYNQVECAKFCSSENLRYSYLNNKSENFNSFKLKRNFFDMKIVDDVYKKKGERKIFSDNEQIKNIHDYMSCARDTFSNMERWSFYDRNSSYMSKCGNSNIGKNNSTYNSINNSINNNVNNGKNSIRNRIRNSIRNGSCKNSNCKNSSCKSSSCKSSSCKNRKCKNSSCKKRYGNNVNRNTSWCSINSCRCKNFYEDRQKFPEDVNINEIILEDLENKITNNMKNNYYDSGKNEQTAKANYNEKNIDEMLVRKCFNEDEFCFEINNEKYRIDLSLHESRFVHMHKSGHYNNSNNNIGFSTKENFRHRNGKAANRKTTYRKVTHRNYTRSSEECNVNNTKDSFFSIVEYFPNYFYNTVETLYINIILIFIYVYCLFIITVHGGLNNDFPLYFYFLNMKKKKSKKTKKVKEKKYDSSEHYEENVKVDTRKKNEEKNYTSNFLFKSKRIFKNWKQRRKSNKKNIKLNISKNVSVESNDMKNNYHFENNIDSIFLDKGEGENKKLTDNSEAFEKDEKENLNKKWHENDEKLTNYNVINKCSVTDKHSNVDINILCDFCEKEKERKENEEWGVSNVKDHIDIISCNIKEEKDMQSYFTKGDYTNRISSNVVNSYEENDMDRCYLNRYSEYNIYNLNVSSYNNDNNYNSFCKWCKAKSFENVNNSLYKDEFIFDKTKFSLNNNKFLKPKYFSMSELRDHCKNKFKEFNFFSNDNFHKYYDENDATNGKFSMLYVDDEKKKKSINFFNKLKDIKEEKIIQIKNMYKSEKNNKRFKKGLRILKRKINSEVVKYNFYNNKGRNTSYEDQNRGEKKGIQSNLQEFDTNVNIKELNYMQNLFASRMGAGREGDYMNSTDNTGAKDNNISVNNNYFYYDNLEEYIYAKKNNEDIYVNNTPYVRNYPDYKSCDNSKNFVRKNSFIEKRFLSNTSTYKEGNFDMNRNKRMTLNLNFNNYEKWESDYAKTNFDKSIPLVHEKKILYNELINSKSKKIKNKIISYMKSKANKEQKHKFGAFVHIKGTDSSILNNEIYIKDINKINLMGFKERIFSKNPMEENVHIQKDNDMSFLKISEDFQNFKKNSEIINLTLDHNEERSYNINVNRSFTRWRDIRTQNRDYIKFLRSRCLSDFEIHESQGSKDNNKKFCSDIMYKNLETENGNDINIICPSISKKPSFYSLKNDKKIKYDVFNRPVYITDKNSICKRETEEQSYETEDKNNIFSKRKKIFLNMKNKFIKLKNKNKNIFFKDALKNLVNKPNINFNYECDEEKKNSFKKNSYIVNNSEPDEYLTEVKKRTYLTNTLERNNDKCYNSLDEFSYFDNSSKKKINALKKQKESEVIDANFKNERSLVNKFNTSNYRNDIISNNKNKDQNIYHKGFDKKKNSASNLIGEHEDKCLYKTLIRNKSKGNSKLLYNKNCSNDRANNHNNDCINDRGNYGGIDPCKGRGKDCSNDRNNLCAKDKRELTKYVNTNILKKKKKREKHAITIMINNCNKFLLNKKYYYNSVEKDNSLLKFYYNFLMFMVNYFLIFTISYIYINNIYNLFICSKHLHVKGKKKERKRNGDFNHIVRIIYNKNVFSANARTLHTSKNKNICMKKNIFAQIFVQNKKQSVKTSEKCDQEEEEESTDSKQMNKSEIRHNFSPNRYYEEIKDKKNILSMYKNAKSNIKIFMSKHMILNLYLEKFLNLFNHKNFNLTKIVISLLGYISILLLPIKFHHLVIVKLLHMYYKGYFRRYYKNIVLNSILENIKNIRMNLKLYKPICSLNEEEYCALIEEINKTCNQCLNISQFKDIIDEYDLANAIMKNLKEISEMKKIIKHEWNHNLLNNSPHDNTSVINLRCNTLY
ncbi:hypothetical protein MKS88_004446 [Plasmodium brasilianum]|uniref:Uncharacterized protein n=1 Tax=Plasmodium brasilianum TaxID=5824 RepID=A0ACB9Y7A7_PLABR|nr:hypothetical protein MKS88_004446 [Plasmodium brasilianum]